MVSLISLWLLITTTARFLVSPTVAFTPPSINVIHSHSCSHNNPCRSRTYLQNDNRRTPLAPWVYEFYRGPSDTVKKRAFRLNTLYAKGPGRPRTTSTSAEEENDDEEEDDEDDMDFNTDADENVEGEEDGTLISA